MAVNAKKVSWETTAKKLSIYANLVLEVISAKMEDIQLAT